MSGLRLNRLEKRIAELTQRVSDLEDLRDWTESPDVEYIAGIGNEIIGTAEYTKAELPDTEQMKRDMDATLYTKQDPPIYRMEHQTRGYYRIVDSEGNPVPDINMIRKSRAEIYVDKLNAR